MAGALLGLWLIVRHGRETLRIDRGQLGGAVLVGMLLLAGGNGLVVLAERTVPSGLTALIVASVPLWIVVFRLAAGDRISASLHRRRRVHRFPRGDASGVRRIAGW